MASWPLIPKQVRYLTPFATQPTVYSKFVEGDPIKSVFTFRVFLIEEKKTELGILMRHCDKKKIDDETKTKMSAVLLEMKITLVQ